MREGRSRWRRERDIEGKVGEVVQPGGRGRDSGEDEGSRTVK